MGGAVAPLRRLRPGNFLSRVAVDTKHPIGLRIWRSAEIWMDVLPNHVAFGGDFEEPAEPALVDERVPSGDAGRLIFWG